MASASNVTSTVAIRSFVFANASLEIASATKRSGETGARPAQSVRHAVHCLMHEIIRTDEKPPREPKLFVSSCYRFNTDAAFA